MMMFLSKSTWPREFRERLEIDIKNDQGIKNLVQALVIVFKEYVPRERMRDALARLQSLTGIGDPGAREGGESKEPEPQTRIGLLSPHC